MASAGDLPTTLKTVYHSAQNYGNRIRHLPFGDGYGQRATDGINTLEEKHKVRFIGDSSDVINMSTFLEGTSQIDYFTWIPPRSTSTKLFVCERWTVTPLSDDIDQLDAVFARVYDIST